MIKSELEITKYDTTAGDGDCGTGPKRGAAATPADTPKGPLPTDTVAFVNRIVPVVENTMDGTSGAIYGIFLNALAHGIRQQDAGSAKQMDTKMWAAALQSSLAALGNRTLMDALLPFVETLGKTGDVKAADAAKQGAENTKSTKARLGTAVYVGMDREGGGSRSLGVAGVLAGVGFGLTRERLRDDGISASVSSFACR